MDSVLVFAGLVVATILSVIELVRTTLGNLLAWAGVIGFGVLALAYLPK